MSDLAFSEQIERLAYSPSEAAAALGCSRQHIQNCIRRGDIPSVKLGRKRLIARHVLADLLGVNDATPSTAV
jgi:excisionase family DNA binding protein